MRFLFRFRDLVAPTLERHREVIGKHGSVWWGWWKRPSEDARRPVWNEMSLLIKPDSPVEVGLFDSGHGKVYRAIVAEIVSPREDASGVVKLPESEREWVPEYYRESPFSRAWMRMTSIAEEEELEFFGKYSFREAPPLSQYGKGVLKRFENKVVVSADELRGMDTTIWAIRPKETSDHRELVILSTRAPSTPIARDPIELKSNVILHLSDLHFAVGDDRVQHRWKLLDEGGHTLADAIDSALKGADVRIGAVVVTGDLTFSGSDAEFESAYAFLGKLTGILDIAPEHIVVVPGNHDIRWSKEDRYKDGALVEIAPAKAKAGFKKFYERLQRHAANDTLSTGRRFVLPSGMILDVAGLNSSSLETGKDFLAGMGRIEEHALDEIANEMNWRKDRGNLAVRVLALHHHVVLTEDLEPAEGYSRGFGIAVDAPRIQRRAAGFGVHLVLHGHKHRVFLWKSGVFNSLEHSTLKHHLGDLWVVGGGSAGSTEVPDDGNYFNTFAFEPEGARLSIFKSVAGRSFEEMQKWQGSFQLRDGRLVFGEWELEKSR